jgi:hypothetical protein
MHLSLRSSTHFDTIIIFIQFCPSSVCQLRLVSSMESPSSIVSSPTGGITGGFNGSNGQRLDKLEEGNLAVGVVPNDGGLLNRINTKANIAANSPNTTNQSREIMNYWRADTLVGLFVVWPFAFCACTFSIFFALHADEMYLVEGVRQIPTISLSGAFMPESIFLTLGLHVQAALFILLLNSIYHVYSVKCDAGAQENSEASTYFSGLADESRGCCTCVNCLLFSHNIAAVRFWNVTAYWIGIACSIFLALTGSVSVGYYPNVHGTCAVLMFLTGIVVMIVYHCKVCRPFMVAAPSQRRGLILQYVALSILIPFSILMLILDIVVSSTCSSKSCLSYSVNITVVLEFTTVISLLLFVESFRSDLKWVTISTVLDDLYFENSRHDNTNSPIR